MTMLWELPEVLLFQIVSFAAGPTHRAFILCHVIAPLCHASRKALLDDSNSNSTALWDAVLKDDYGVQHSDSSSSLVGGSKNQPTKRSCKRLKRTHLQRVRDAHLLVKDNTEIAYFFMSEMAHAPSGCGKDSSLTRVRLCRLLNKYGPHLRINNVTSTGGTFLVECCRAHPSKEGHILRCVQELVERRGASVNLCTEESAQSNLSALCVAAARGMPKVVQYLIQHGASTQTKSTGRFRLHTNRKRTVRCTKATPLEFAEAVCAAERAEGATDEEVAALKKCMKLLKKHSNAKY